MALIFYISAVKELKLKFRKFLGLLPTFIEVTKEKIVRMPFYRPLPPSHPEKVKKSKTLHDTMLLIRLVFKTMIYILPLICFRRIFV